MPKLPPNEIGFALCRLPKGGRRKFARGPLAVGTPDSVTVPTVCPAGRFAGMFHTHPGGVARPSGMDVREARRVGAQGICIASDSALRCYRVRG